jgi:small redox-active disulfide protein 2
VEIKILGSGCPNCKRLEKLAREAVAELGIEANVTKVQDFDKIMAYDITSTPAMVVDEVVKVSGRVPRKDEIVALLQTA